MFWNYFIELLVNRVVLVKISRGAGKALFIFKIIRTHFIKTMMVTNVFSMPVWDDFM